MSSAPKGELPRESPRPTASMAASCFFEYPGAVAIDNSPTSPSQGALYVADIFGQRVVKYRPQPPTEEYELAPTQISSPHLDYPSGLAVDSDGDLYVTDIFAEGSSVEAILEFDPSGNEIAPVSTVPATGEPNSIAVDAAGDVFVQGASRESQGLQVPRQRLGGNRRRQLRTNRQQAQPALPWTRPPTPSTSRLGNHVNRYDATTLASKGAFGSGALTATNQIAVNSQSGRVYVADSGAHDVAVFEDLILPDVQPVDPTAVTTEAATLKGKVNPAGLPLSECGFEYITDQAYKENEDESHPLFSGAATASCAESPASIGEGTEPVAVHADVSGLTAGAAYHFRLLAKNANGTANSGEAKFRAAGPPEVKEEFARPHDTSARLGAILYSGRQNSTYHFEYVDQAGFEADEFTGATKVPVPDGSIAAGTKEDVEVLAQIGGLDSGSQIPLPGRHHQPLRHGRGGRQDLHHPFPLAALRTLPQRRAPHRG